jgi:peptide methionine sulfoxide reductase MsrA
MARTPRALNVSYGKILQIFSVVHDPTELNRQGPDVTSDSRDATRHPHVVT